MRELIRRIAAAARTPGRFVAHETARQEALNGAPLAGFRARAIAFLVDFLLSGVAFLAVVLPLGTLAAKLGWIKTDVHLEYDFHHWYTVPFILVYFGLLAWATDGRTPGKRLTRIRIVSLTHERLTLWQALERALGYGASALEGGFGFLQYFFEPNRRTVHDRIAETIVVNEPEQS